MTAFKLLIFLILFPGLFLGYFPYSIAASDVQILEPGIFRYLAIILWTIGSIIMLWGFWGFTFKGHGTPAPIDPPKELVITGLYRYVRNPMYVGGIIILLGWLIWSPSLPLIAAPVVFFLVAHSFVLFYEEPSLRKKFGLSYEVYCKSIPRWVPHFTNYD